MIDSVRQAGMPKSCTKMGILTIFILFLTFKIFNLPYLGAFWPEVLIRGVPSEASDSFSEVLRARRTPPISSQKFWEAFRPLRFLLRSSEKLSDPSDSFSEVLGGFPTPPIPSQKF